MKTQFKKNALINQSGSQTIFFKYFKYLIHLFLISYNKFVCVCVDTWWLLVFYKAFVISFSSSSKLLKNMKGNPSNFKSLLLITWKYENVVYMQNLTQLSMKTIKLSVSKYFYILCIHTYVLHKMYIHTYLVKIK